MDLQELEDSLPNGFHDSKLEGFTVDYVSRTAVLKMRLLVGTPDGATEEEREDYKPAELHLSDVVYFVIDAPDPNYKYAESKGLWVNAGRAGEGKGPAPRVSYELLPKRAFAYWFFVHDWNSFIHVAALGASLQWT